MPNATQALQQFRNALKAFREIHIPHVEKLRKQCSGNPSGQASPAIEELLETHGRNYLINHLLSAMNWRIEVGGPSDLPNLVPEAAVSSVATKETRYMDYLGVERETDYPLLIVETKRPNSPIPQFKSKKAQNRGKGSGGRAVSSAQTPASEDIAQVVLEGLQGEPLLYKWNEWLEDLRDYFQSVRMHGGRPASRVLITDGNWCILFHSPEQAFLDSDNASKQGIYVYTQEPGQLFGQALESNFEEIYGFLAYNALTEQLPPIFANQVNFFVDSTLGVEAMRGLRLVYRLDNEIYTVKPKILVSPVLFLRSGNNSWLQVERRDVKYVPFQEDDLKAHLAEMQRLSDELCQEVSINLQTTLQWVPLLEHYADDNGFTRLPGVKEISPAGDFILVTGTYSHYLKESPSISGCKYHDWMECHSIHMQSPEVSAILACNVELRAFFSSPCNHHCAHKAVAGVKSQALIPSVRPRCGSRSGLDNGAFCEIWGFERYLCCRTCIFEEVCSQSQVFRLPCSTQTTPATVTTKAKCQ